MPKNILLIQHDAREAELVGQALSHADGDFQLVWVRTVPQALERLATLGKQRGDALRGIAAVLLDLDDGASVDCTGHDGGDDDGDGARVGAGADGAGDDGAGDDGDGAAVGAGAGGAGGDRAGHDGAGIEAFDRLFDAAPQVPICVLVDAQHEDIAKLAVKRGAQDYLLKSRLDDYLLPRALSNMIERSAVADALFAEKERAEVTLNSIGDAVISTDEWGAVTYLNEVAEALTGWSLAEALGRPVGEVFPLIDAATREPAPHPMARAMRENRTVGLTPNCVMVRRDGFESAIEDSAAPIHDRQGSVTGAVMVFHDVSAARALSTRMAHLAQHDSLTDLPNRLLFNDRLTQALALAHRHGTKLAVLYLDIDRFKHVNDSRGHSIGDRLLQSVAGRLLGCVRSSDTVSRQGGDEFVVLLCEITHAADALVAADKMLAAVSEPHRIDDLELHVSASIGIVTYPMDGTSADSLLENADTAMYRAKQRGRNNHQFFTAELNLHALERQNLENDLRHALARDEFVLHYQPKFNLRTGAITGVESLIRWRHPARRLIRPSRFISIAEETGLIVPIGRWVLGEACRQAQAWQAAGLPAMSVAVNVSSVELRAKNFVAGVRSILSETGLAARHLELEVTETFLMQDAASTATVLGELKTLGVQLALDDFGTGYSSLSYLRRFPIDTLKIDHSFIRHVTTDADDAGMVSAVVNMGKGLRMRVVAEGVETLEQFTLLKEQRCPEAQGFFFSEPVMASAITELFVQNNWHVEPILQ